MNIGPREQRKRLVMGLALLILGAAVGIALIAAGAGRWWRLALFAPFWLGALGAFQAREKT